MKTAHSVASRKKRKKLLQKAKGYRGERSKKLRRAKESVRRGLVYAYRDRKNKKREFRALWITRLNAAVRDHGITYRTFISAAKKKNVVLSRDVLAQIAADTPGVFDAVVEFVMQ